MKLIKNVWAGFIDYISSPRLVVVTILAGIALRAFISVVTLKMLLGILVASVVILTVVYVVFALLADSWKLRDIYEGIDSIPPDF